MARYGILLPIMAALLVTFSSESARGQIPGIRAFIKPDSLTIGDRFAYVNIIDAPLGTGLEPLPVGEKLGDATVLSPVAKLPGSPAGTISYACTLSVYQPGPVKIPTFAFRDINSPDTNIYSGDTLTINIASVLPADTTGLEMADIRGPRRLRGPIWPYLATAIALALLTYGGLQLRDRWRRKIIQPEIPPVPPWDLAFGRLDALKAERHIEFGRFKQFYFELSLIIRGYIEGRYETPAVESTTHELGGNEAIKSLPDSLFGRLFVFLERADLVKFAKSIPSTSASEGDLKFAYDFVVQTKPVIVDVSAVAAVPQEVKA